MNSESRYILKGIIYLVLILIVSYIGYHLCSYKHDEKNQTPDNISNIPDFFNDSSFIAGKVLFEDHCSICHKIKQIIFY